VKKTMILIGLAGFAGPATASVTEAQTLPLVTAEVQRVRGGAVSDRLEGSELRIAAEEKGKVEKKTKPKKKKKGHEDEKKA
jgi:hypothetical protein